MRFFLILFSLSAISVHGNCGKITKRAVLLPEENNDSPIIGILTQEISWHLNKKYPGQYKSYIAASYVKFVEGGGARVVPIWIGQPRSYYLDILFKVNGVLFPGGATWFNQTDGYADAGRHIYEIAIEMNDRGNYMPIWGTCLGFELLTYLSARNEEHRAHCSSLNQALPLEFVEGSKNSELFSQASDEIINILQTEPVTANFHQFCVTRKNMSDHGLDEDWNIMSVNHDWNGLEFVSSIEHKRYPFYGIQFHPEKNIYEWVKNKNISHTTNARKASQFFANFFIDETRKNYNRFKTKCEENDYLIYNYPVTFTAKRGSSFIQSYLFGEDVRYGYSCESSTKQISINLLE